MMPVIVPRSWREEFAAVAARREGMLHREKLAHHDEKERERRKEDKLDSEQQDAEAWTAIELVLAAPEDVAEFRVQIDDYDATTVEALMENRALLDAVRAKMDTALMEAHVLPDGRKVFKTKDGLRVVDQNGNELTAEVIDPSEIDDKKTKWETFKALKDEKEVLEAEQQELLAYQQKLDEARERLDKGEVMQKELETMKKDLADDMPDAVRAKLDIEPKANTAPAQELAAATPALPANMDDLMRQTGLGAGPAGP